MSRQILRHSLRNQRRLLSPQQQQMNSRKLCSKLTHFSPLKRAKRIAVYLCTDGEINLEPIIKWIWGSGKTCVLPVLNKKKAGHLFFLPYKKNQTLVKNKYSIAEPQYSLKQIRHARQVDVILMPLVGFDRSGNRIGMGGGYYDRTLAFLTSNGSTNRPKLIGVAHSLQEIEKIQAEKWDIRLSAIATEKEIIIPTPYNQTKTLI